MDKRFIRISVILVILIFFLQSASTKHTYFLNPNTLRLGVVGDFGDPTTSAMAVSRMIDSWHPEAVITVGDNNRPEGDPETFGRNVTRPYGSWVEEEKFFASLGNHDWGANDSWSPDELPQIGLLPYLKLYPPYNGRYYEAVFGDDLVHVFILDSDAREPDGRTSDSPQGQWLKAQLAASTSRYNLIFMHVPPYSSCLFGDNPALQWPFGDWGADIVLSGHCHFYERLEIDGFPYIINGLGGANERTPFELINSGSMVRFIKTNGAILIQADADHLELFFVTISGDLIDTYIITKPD